MKKIKHAIIKMLNLMKKCISLVFYLCPIKKNKIIVFNFFGRGYGDNPKYIVKEILSRKLDCDIIWFVNKHDDNMPKEVKQVKYNSLSCYYHMITAKLWLDTIRNNIRPPFKRKKQFYVQCWHGGLLALKAVEKAAEDHLPKKYVKAAKKDAKLTNLFLSASDNDTVRIKRDFWYDGEIFQAGVPKVDIILQPDPIEINEFKKRNNLIGKKIVLYAPTFRSKPGFYDKVDIDINKVVERLNKRFGGDFVFCVRLHPNDCKHGLPKCLEGAIALTDEPDSQVILSATDVVISDVSGMLLDMFLTNRPTFIYMPDYEEYIKNERGLYIDLKSLPSPFSENAKQLIFNVDNFDESSYENERKKLIEQIGAETEGLASKKIVDYLINKNVIK